MQASAAVETEKLAGSCLAKPSASNRQLPKDDSQAADESILKQTPVPASPTQDEQLNEAEAIRLARSGDAAAFECLYRLHSRRVYALCRRMVGDPNQAEDLTQGTFLLLFRKIHTFRYESAFSTWLHRLTVNVVLMHLRKKSPPTVSIEATYDPDDETCWLSVDASALDPLLAGSIDRVNLERCIERLPVGYRTIFVLHDIQGYEHHEIGEMLGRSEGDSKSQLHKARTRLRELLHEDQRQKARNHRLAARKVPPQSTLVAA
ncbi:MAG TPA: sigma-70 family RNA polymerase sigma factor [Candidatus Acidoferrum sp.]|nr:sigma-70 family RNA polymerase sigma factor [Candidatus Acidoferrum sp.]